ncbi:MAG: hypothetical protein AAGF12_19540 [Myxococcota bacterium]
MRAFLMCIVLAAGCYQESRLLETADGGMADGTRPDGAVADDSAAPDAQPPDGSPLPPPSFPDPVAFPRPECGLPGTALSVPGTVSDRMGRFDQLGSREGASCWGTEGPEDHYILENPVRQAVRITRSGDSTALSIRRGCTQDSEVVCAHPSTFGDWQGILDPGDYALLLDTWAPEFVNYTITTELYEAADNASCDGAMLLGDAPIIGQDPRNGGQGSFDHCTRSGRPMLFYYYDLPPRTALKVNAESETGRHLLGLHRPCRETEGACEHFSATEAGSIGSVANPTDAYRRVFAGVSNWVENEPGTFRISQETMPLEPHAFCDAAMDLDAQTLPLRQEGMTAGQRPGRSGNPDDRVFYYRVTVPPMTRMDAAVTNAGATTNDRFLSQWSTSCGGEGQPSADNFSAAPASWILAVHWRVGGDPPAFDLRLETTPLAPNGECTASIALPPGGASPVQSLGAGGFQPVSCTPHPQSRYLWFRTTVPADSSVEVQGDVVESEDVYAFVWMTQQTRCSGSCVAVAGELRATPPNPTTMLLDNRGNLAPREFVYAATLDGLGGPPTGTFELTVSPPQ